MRPPECFYHLHSSYLAILPASTTRADWYELPFRRLIAETLDGPYLVFLELDDDARSALRWHALIERLRDRFLHAHDKQHRINAAVKLRELWRVYVGLAVGYSYLGAHLDGRRAVFAFDA